jgi:hypothetical protein
MKTSKKRSSLAIDNISVGLYPGHTYNNATRTTPGNDRREIPFSSEPSELRVYNTLVPPPDKAIYMHVFFH